MVCNNVSFRPIGLFSDLDSLFRFQPWVNEAHSLIQAFYGGNDLGSGLADVLFGKRDFSGKLPLSFPCVFVAGFPLNSFAKTDEESLLSRVLSDNPSFVSFVGENGKVVYNEGCAL